MELWIDADACPQVIKEIVIKAATRLGLKTTFVANKPIAVPQTELFSFVQIARGPDVADQYIVDQATAGDLVITQDIPLAALLVAKQVWVINPHGVLFTDANIGERLASRDLMQGLREAGMVSGGPKPFGERDKRQFANAFDQLLTRLLKSS